MDPSYSKKSILGTPLADGAYAGAHILACLLPNLQKVTFPPGISTELDINGLGPLQPWGRVSAQGHCKSLSHRGHLTNDSSFQLCVPPHSTGASQCHTRFNCWGWHGVQTQSLASSVYSDSMRRWFPGEAKAKSEEWEMDWLSSLREVISFLWS